jgi:DNA-binding NtrC family response regulator
LKWTAKAFRSECGTMCKEVEDGPMAQIAVVDDQELLRDSLQHTLKRSGHAVRTFADPRDAVSVIRKGAFELVITDLKMPGMDGVELLRQIRSGGGEMPVIVMTAFGTIASAVEAMRLGAYDYIQKPFEGDEIELLVERALRASRLMQENEALRRTVSDLMGGDRPLVGDSAAMRVLKGQIDRIAASEATVLVEGESGTGKEMVSRSIHRASRRSDRPMLCLNCAALTETLLESELFGHEKGAFTGADKARKGRFELADGGTLLLDEISEIPLPLQAKLLRVLQEKQFERVGSSVTRDVDVRVIATTNRDLRQWVQQGRFREDLYYRLSVLPVYVPPLRQRRGDIGVLAEHFLGQLARRDGRIAPTVPADVATLLEDYHWPGNVRELENLIERAWVMTAGEAITVELLQPWLSRPMTTAVSTVSATTATPTAAGLSRPAAGASTRRLEDIERDMILRTLTEFKGHRAKTAKALGIGLRTLGLKLKRWREEGLEALESAELAHSAQFVREGESLVEV